MKTFRNHVVVEAYCPNMWNWEFVAVFNTEDEAYAYIREPKRNSSICEWKLKECDRFRITHIVSSEEELANPLYKEKQK